MCCVLLSYLAATLEASSLCSLPARSRKRAVWRCVWGLVGPCVGPLGRYRYWKIIVKALTSYIIYGIGNFLFDIRERDASLQEQD